jgi:hypothetical protein
MSKNTDQGGERELKLPTAKTRFTLGKTEETMVDPDMPSRHIPAPSHIAPNPFTERSHLATMMAIDDQAEEDSNQRREEGYGPKIVILHDFVSGPGPETGFRRGQVISLSRLLGDDLMKDETQAIRYAKRYFTGKAVREATQEESQYDMVEFIEGEEALEQHAAAREEELQSLKYQNMKLADIIRKLGGDPTKDPEEQQAEVIPPVGSGLGDEAKF